VPVSDTVHINERCIQMEGEFEGGEFWNIIQSKWPGIEIYELVIGSDKYAKFPGATYDIDISDFGVSIVITANNSYFERINKK
jgi:hypothetical protein